jgi:hypothetical protein
MRRFHGDLLMGGVSIRDIDGVLDDMTLDGSCQQEGSFEVEAQTASSLEVGRPYLLLMDGGDSVKLVMKEIDLTSDPCRLHVQFECTS